jgi:CRISPR/Cas system-associated exonuclease Cas4 (RecB family)
MTITTSEDIGTCPRRWALSAADYPDIWAGRGYPAKIQVHALRGSAVHLAVEMITKNLVRAGCPSVQHPIATLVLKELGGYTKVVQDCIDRVLDRFTENPRGARLLETAGRTLRGQIPDIRIRVQSILTRLRLPPIPQGQEQDRTAGSKVRRPLTAGAFPEVELRVPRIRWKGKADLLVISDQVCEITDFKTGAPDEAHKFQVQVYALLWSLDGEINPTHRLADRLVLAYSTADVEVAALSQEQLHEFEKHLLQLREGAEAALSVRPPEARPTPENCRYCGVRQLCDEYWVPSNRLPNSTNPQARFSDVAIKILRRHGPMSWDAVIERSPGIATGKSALLRIQDAVELQPGKLVRILDAAIAVDPDDEGQPVIVTLAAFSEIFAVA